MKNQGVGGGGFTASRAGAGAVGRTGVGKNFVVKVNYVAATVEVQFRGQILFGGAGGVGDEGSDGLTPKGASGHAGEMRAAYLSQLARSPAISQGGATHETRQLIIVVSAAARVAACVPMVPEVPPPLAIYRHSVR